MAETSLIYRLAISLLILITKSWRLKIIGTIPENGLCVFWHGYMLPVWLVLRVNSPVAVVSQSKDGSILSALLERWGYSLIRGSSSKDGKLVLNEICSVLPDKLVLMTPDGPRGPLQKMKAGAVIAAKRTGVPLYLTGVRLGPHYSFNKSWDKFKLPLPFAKIEIIISESIFINENLSRSEIDTLINECETKLNRLYL